MHGGLAQGIGQALQEHLVYDRDTGQLVSASFADYAMPTAAFMPFVDSALEEIPCTTNPLGVKGIGEAGTIGAPPTIINALRDALRPPRRDRYPDACHLAARLASHPARAVCTRSNASINAPIASSPGPRQDSTGGSWLAST